MICYKGIMLPDSETHMQKHLDKGPYQGALIQCALKVTKGRKVALDVGAAVGLWSIPLAKEFKMVIAYEPHPLQFECLLENIRKSASRRVKPLQLALGNREQIRYVKDLRESGNLGMTSLDIEQQGCAWKCEVSRLDSALFTDLDLIKLDVEGMEHFVLEGGEKTLREHMPTLVVELKGLGERYGCSDKETLKMLEDWGYRGFAQAGSDYIITKEEHTYDDYF